MNILFTSVAISQLKCLDYAFFVAKMSKMTFTRFGGQVWLDGGQVRQFRGREYVSYLYQEWIFTVYCGQLDHLKIHHVWVDG